jgi:hypothetical protein
MAKRIYLYGGLAGKPSTLLVVPKDQSEFFQHAFAFLARADRDPQRAFAAIFSPSEPDNDLVLLGHVGISPLGFNVVGNASPTVSDLGENKVGLVGAEDPDDPVQFRQLGQKELAVLEEGLDVATEEGEAGGGEGAQGERGGRGRDVVGGFDVVEDLDDLG